MQAKKLLIMILGLIFSYQSYSANNQCNLPKKDSVYRDLTTFLIQKKYLNKELKDIGKKYIEIIEILSKNDTIDLADIPFGIFKFQSKLCMDCGYFVLIKYQGKYMVFNQSNINLIVKLIIEIKTNNPELINCEQFETYIKNLSDVTLVNSEQVELVQKIGQLEYIYKNK